MTAALERSEPPGLVALPAQVGPLEGGGEERPVGHPLDEVPVALGSGHLEAPAPPVVVAPADLDSGTGDQRPGPLASRLLRIDHWARSLPARRPLGNRRRRLLSAFTLIALLALAGAGCSLAQGFVSTVKELDAAGFTSADIETAGVDSFRVSVTRDTEDLSTAAAEAAGVVWRELPVRIERLEVVCTNGFGGEGTYAADRAELEQRFGPRDPALDEGFQESDARTIAVVLLGLFLGGLLILGAIVVLIVVLVRRNRRRSPPPGPPAPPEWGAQPPPPGYGPPS